MLCNAERALVSAADNVLRRSALQANKCIRVLGSGCEASALSQVIHCHMFRQRLVASHW